MTFSFWMSMHWPTVFGIGFALFLYGFNKRLATILHYRWMRKYKLPSK